jgi:DNA-binding transcriptional regulator YiaG
MKTKPFPTDPHGTTPSPEDWERNQDSFERHTTAAAQSPRFEQTRKEIADRQATLSELRRAFQLSQVTLAETLDMSQSELSRLERRADLLLSTLTRFVAATGGHLRLIADYPDRPAIELRLATLLQTETDTDTDNQLTPGAGV